MSNKAIRAALETAFAAISPALATSYVGDNYDLGFNRMKLIKKGRSRIGGFL